jgi:hypothetical protein
MTTNTPVKAKAVKNELNTHHKKELLFDLRLRDKFLAEGKITKAQVDQFLSELPDDQNNAQAFDSGELPTQPMKK